MNALAPSSPVAQPQRGGSAVIWHELPAAAQLLDKSEGHLRRLCGAQWQAEGKARLLQVPGEKSRWQIRSDADPALSLSPPVPQFLSALVPSSTEFSRLPAAARAKAQERARLLAAWTNALAAARTMALKADQATAMFLDAHRAEFSAIGGASSRTLKRWRSAHHRDGLLGLVDGRANKSESGEGKGGGDPFLEEVKSLWLVQGGVSVAICHKMALLRARQNGWEFRSYRATARFIAQVQQQEAAKVKLLRGGEEDFKNDVARHITRDYSTLGSNEIWNADHHQFDVMVKVGERTDTRTGEVESLYGRPWLTAWQDLRSRKIVGWSLGYYGGRGPNTDAIAEALGNGCRTHCAPQNAYTDNGKDFDAKALTGRTKKQRRQGLEIDEKRLGGIYAALGITQIHAWPFHGQSKPIERFFLTLEDRFCKTFATYCGRSPEQRPERLYGAPGKPHQGTLAKGLAPTLQEFTEKFATWLEVDYHQRIHTGDSMDCTPAQAWEANLSVKRVAPPELLEVLLQRRYGPLKVSQNGLVHKGIWFGQYELASWLGQEVFITLDGRQMQTVSVWSSDGRFLCVARANLRVAANATPAMLGEVIARQKKENKILRDAARIKPRLYMDRTDLLNEAAAEEARRNAGASPLQTDPTPPAISPIRSELESQLEAVRQQREMPLKKAVGDGTPPPATPSFQYRSVDQDAGDGEPSGFVYHGRSSSEDDL